MQKKFCNTLGSFKIQKLWSRNMKVISDDKKPILQLPCQAQTLAYPSLLVEDE